MDFWKSLVVAVVYSLSKYHSRPASWVDCMSAIRGFFFFILLGSVVLLETLSKTGELAQKMTAARIIYIQFSSPLYEHHNSVVYSYFLKGYDEKWSDWTKKTKKIIQIFPPEITPSR